MQQQWQQPQTDVSPSSPQFVEVQTPAPVPQKPRLKPPQEYTDSVLKLLHKLRRKKLFRQMAANPYSDEWQTPETITHLINLLRKHSDKRWRERIVAAWALGQIEIEAEEDRALIHTLGLLVENKVAGKGEMVVKRGWGGIKRSLKAGFIGSSILVSALAYSGAFVMGDDGAFHAFNPFLAASAFLMIGLTLAMLGFFIMMPLSLGMDVERANRLRLAATFALGRFPSPSGVGPLASVLARNPAPQLRDAAIASLYETLPTLNWEHYGQLGPDVVPNLCLALYADKGYALDRYGYLSFLLLEAIEKIGDGRAVWYAEEVGKRTPNLALRERIAQVLPVLQARYAREQASGMLLRAASGPVSDSDELLRAASGSSGTIAPEELLRSSALDTDTRP